MFGTELEQVESHDPVQGRRGHPPAALRRAGACPPRWPTRVVAVLGLDDRPQARTRFRPRRPPSAPRYTPLELGRGLPRSRPAPTAAGRRWRSSSSAAGTPRPTSTPTSPAIGLADPPTVTAVGVDGADNAPGGHPNGADGEVLLDIEVAGALAPGADIVVYFAPNTDRGFLDALSQAAHADPTPAAISISWGQSEDEWTAQARTRDGRRVGRRRRPRRHGHARPPATTAAPTTPPTAQAARRLPRLQPARPGLRRHHAAGRRRHRRGEQRGRLEQRRRAAARTGGGVSAVFPLPAWQAAAGVPGDADTGRPGRGVPDVSADADPATGYQVRVDGSDIGHRRHQRGRPAVGRALACRLAQALGQRPGLLQPVLYAGLSAGDGAGRLPGRHHRQQRRVPAGRRGLGRVHRPRRPRRRGPAGGAPELLP